MKTYIYAILVSLTITAATSIGLAYYILDSIGIFNTYEHFTYQDPKKEDK